jgi:hypothetical protein
MVSLVRLQGQLFQRLDSLLSQLLNLSGKHGLGLDSGVDTVGLDGDDDSSLVLEEQVCVQGDNSGLIRLGNIGEDSIDHTDKHSVLLGVSSILNDGDDVRSLLGHAYQVSAGSVGELNGVDGTGGAHDIGNMGNGGSGSSTKVKDLGSGADEELIETTENTCSQLGSEGVPHSVLDLGGLAIGGGGRNIDRNSLLAVDRLTGGQVLGDKEILLTSGNEDTAVSMGLDNDLGSALGTTSSTTSTTTGTASGTTSGTTSAAPSASSSSSVSAESTSSTTSSAKPSSATSSTTVSAAESSSASASSTSRSKAHYVYVLCFKVLFVWCNMGYCTGCVVMNVKMH